MIDPRIVRDEPGRIRDMLRDRAVEYDLDALVAANSDRLGLMQEADRLRAEKNKAGAQIASAKKSGGDAGPVLARMKELSEEAESLEARRAEAVRRYERLAMSLPNLVDPSVPPGGPEANKEIRRWGSPPSFEFEPRDHIDIAEGLGLVDIARAAKVAGSRFYYLRDDLVMLSHALVQFALEFLSRRGYSPVQPPYMINRASMEGAVVAGDFEEAIYKVEGQDLFLIGTSEHSMAAMHSGEIIDGADLPIRYAGASPCFRKEAGAHGRDQKGIFRVHQFEKVEQFVFARPEDSGREHERMLETAEQFYRELGIPHRVVLLSSSEMGKSSAKTWDIEAWMAGQGAYREVVSCSNCLEYQARRLGIRFRDRTNEQTQLLHTLNSTLVATTRVLVAILENNQGRDGHVSVPPALRPYVGTDSV